MEFWLWVIMGILICVILGLAVKIFLIRKSAEEIETQLSEKLRTDTNTLITISSRDRHMQKLAYNINTQLTLLRDERRRFQHGDLELKEAVTNISHDLRTPLTAMCGYMDLLKKEAVSDDAKRYIAQIENRTEALKQLTEELFRYSVVSSVQEVSAEKTDIRRILEESLISFYGAMEQKDIIPDIKISENAVERTIDTSALERIFSNIINNALKYSDGDFEVTLNDDGTAIFANTAKNLTPITVGRLFDRFYTVETGRNSTGLGLSIAKLLTERMGGTIKADYFNKKLYITVNFPK